MSDLKCAYHPDRVAVEKCKACGEPLCEECRKKHRHVAGEGPNAFGDFPPPSGSK